jgi:arginase
VNQIPRNTWGRDDASYSNCDRVHVLGVPTGLGAGDARTAHAVSNLVAAGLVGQLEQSGLSIAWQRVRANADTTCPMSPETRRACVIATASNVARSVERAIVNGERFLVLGGDHSIAAGTWSGAARAMRKAGPIGLVWIDAHMDAHVPETSPSGNWHGMPVAHLLGFGDNKLTALAGRYPAIRPESLCLVGVRSFEAEEAMLLQRLGVHVIRMEEVRRQGVAAALAKAFSIARCGTVGFGISLDVDSIDPTDAPGVSTPVPHGICGRAMVDLLRGTARDPNCLGLEIVEYNPAVDVNQKTRTLVTHLILEAFAAKFDPSYLSGARDEFHPRVSLTSNHKGAALPDEI